MTPPEWQLKLRAVVRAELAGDPEPLRLTAEKIAGIEAVAEASERDWPEPEPDPEPDPEPEPEPAPLENPHFPFQD